MNVKTLTREECDRLIEIIRSRAIGCPTAEDGLYGRLSEHPDRIVDSGMFYQKSCKCKQKPKICFQNNSI